ncbi:MAG TPA: FG-GAP repeat protein, partial [Pirellulaceae bacterium]|nr:FG-GAP repeat protein [Pirellulaceae bacterium]
YNLQANGRFGERGALDASGNRILVGAPGEFGTSGGAAIYDDRGRYVGISLRPYRLSTQTTMGDDPTANLGFGVGASVVTDGLYVVGTAPTDTNLKETLYNFRYRGPSWTPLAIDDTLTPAALPKSKVGSSLSIDGGTAVAGAQDYDGRGAAFVFTNTPGTDDWQLASVLQVSGIAIGSHFGSSVSIDGDTIVVGAPDVSNGNGAAYVYQRLGADWPLVKTLDRGTLSGFGRAVDVDGATIVVGADNAASVFEFTSGQWTSAAQLSDTGDFGVSVAVDRDSIVVGAPQASSLAGAVSVFTRDASGGGWSRQGSPLTVLTGAAGDQLGRAVDISGDSILIGAPGVASAQGAAYVFTRAGAVWSQQEKLSVGSGLAG